MEVSVTVSPDKCDPPELPPFLRRDTTERGGDTMFSKTRARITAPVQRAYTLAITAVILAILALFAGLHRAH
jgi:hypothetical protein